MSPDPDEPTLEEHRTGICGPGCPWCDAMVPAERNLTWREYWPTLVVMTAVGAIGAYTAVTAGKIGATREWCARAGFEQTSYEFRPAGVRGYCVWHKPTGDVLIPAEDVRPTPRSST